MPLYGMLGIALVTLIKKDGNINDADLLTATEMRSKEQATFEG